MDHSFGIAVAFGSGLLSFLSPCVLPLFPAYLSFITGLSVADLAGELDPATRRHVLLHAATFVLGFSVVFVALGVSFSAAGQFLLDYQDVIRRAGGGLIIVFGLYLVGLLRPAIFGRTFQWHLRHKPAGYLGTGLIGLTFALGWTPCVGPILGAILSLASTTETVERGVGLLVAYAAGLGVPFLLSAAALGSFLRLFARYRRLIPVTEKAAGVLLVTVGLLLYFDHYAALNAWAVSLTPEWLLDRL